MSHYYTQQPAHSGWATGLPQQKYNPAAYAAGPSHALRSKPSLAVTEIETDFEDDNLSDEEFYHGRRSEDSTSKRSETTISSYDEVRTPNAHSIGFTFHQLPIHDVPVVRGKAMEGPSGPSLFRMSQESAASMDIYLSMSPPVSPTLIRPEAPGNASVKASQELPQFHLYEQQRHHAQQDQHVLAEHQFAEAPRTSVPLRTWTPWQVADWMHALGFERSIIDQFFVNDISGLTLIDLQYNDLKELGIASFGQRHRLWTEIAALKDQTLASNLPPTPGQEILWQAPQPSPPLSRDGRRTATPPQKCNSPDISEDTEMEPNTRRAMRRAVRSDDIISPAESASIVAIEQLLPKPHRCSKGENCSKWKKQQRKLAKIATEFPLEYSQIVESKQQHSPGLESGVGASNSVIVPSVLASSDVLGPSVPKVQLAEENLKGVQHRDPQENVRQFLGFQHLGQPANSDPDTPGYEMFPPLSPPDSAQTPHVNLRTLPKLTIPGESHDGAVHIDMRSTGGERTARPMDRGMTPVTAFYANRHNAASDIYRMGTPASEMDVPVTALPADPLGNARDVSSSVPPDMRFGGPGDLISRPGPRERGPPPAFLNNYPQLLQQAEPQHRTPSHRRSTSQSAASRARRPSFGMSPLPEVKSPIGITLTTQPISNRDTITGTEIDDDEAAEAALQGSGETTPTGPNPQYSGWMRKRRTRMLRHEWAEAHYRLTGTQLTAHRDGNARSAADVLECIDVDDYAVAVAANQSKLNAAMKKLKLAGRDKGDEVWKFGFQLTPAVEGFEKRRGSGGDASKNMGKTHHFAVRNANERIDWMRELMLARAKKGKDATHERFE